MLRFGLLDPPVLRAPVSGPTDLPLPALARRFGAELVVRCVAKPGTPAGVP
jgi:hypothetical protein